MKKPVKKRKPKPKHRILRPDPPPLDIIPDPEVKAKFQQWWESVKRYMGA